MKPVTRVQPSISRSASGWPYAHTAGFLGGIFGFALLIHGGGILSLLAVAFLILSATIMYRHVLQYDHPGLIWSKAGTDTRTIFLSVAAVAAGVFFGVMYRRGLGMESFPAQLTRFAFAAACIGAAEEWIFRGVVFYFLHSSKPVIPVLVGAAGHAGYKALLFWWPVVQQSPDTGRLFFYTFFAGLFLGGMRNLSGSVVPPLLAHAVWDVVVYGHSPHAPWWVW